MPSQPDSAGLQLQRPQSPGRTLSSTPTNAHDAAPGYPEPKKSRPPFGLGIWTFGILIGILTAIVVGAGVGAGLGAALANCPSCRNSEAAPAQTSACPTVDQNDTADVTSPFVVTPAKDIERIKLDCPAPDKRSTEKISSSNKGKKFKWWCGVNAPGGEPAKEGGVISDIAPIIAYSFQDCLHACGQMIQQDEDENTGAKCRSVVFNAKMAEEIKSLGANCFLKNGTKSSTWTFDDDFFIYAERDD